MLRRLRLLRPSGLTCRYVTDVPLRPPHFRDETSPLYISEAFWKGLRLNHRVNLALDFDGSIWNVVRQEAFAAKPQRTMDGKLDFGEMWSSPLEEAKVNPLIQQPVTLRNHPKSNYFLGGVVFWADDASTSVTNRCTFFGDHTFPVTLKSVPAGIGLDQSLWGHLKDDRRLAIVCGVSGSGKTVALLHHPSEAKMVTFYFRAHSLLELQDAAGQPVSNSFAERATTDSARQKRNVAAELAVVTGVEARLDGVRPSSATDVNVLIAIDEAGAYPEFVRALCSRSGDIKAAVGLILRTPNVFIAVAGTGVETSTFAPGSENKQYMMLQPNPNVWECLCRVKPDLAFVLPPNANTRLHRLMRAFVENARAAWALATVVTGRGSLRMEDTTTVATSELPDLCAEAARLLREKNGLSEVSEKSLPYLFVDAVFLQCQITPLDVGDFAMVRKFGVMRDTAQVIDKTGNLPHDLRPNGRQLTADEACLESAEQKAYVKDELRRFEMPATFTAWLHFSLGFGLQSPSGDGLEELTAQFAALALIARDKSYFTPAYWDVVEKRRKPQKRPVPWKVPFHLFEELSQLQGRDSLAAVEIFHLGTQFDPTKVAATQIMEAVAAALFGKPTPETPKKHKVAINGPMSEFADLLVFPQGTRTLCLIQCKGSDKANDAAGSRFGLRDLFTELYKMGCEDDMSCLAGCLKAAQSSSAPEWKELHGVEEFAMAACIAAGKFEVAFALGTQIADESALLKQHEQFSSAEHEELRSLIATRNAAAKTLLHNLQTTESAQNWIQATVSVLETDAAGNASVPETLPYNATPFKVLKAALEAQTAALNAHCEFKGMAKAPLTRALSAVVSFCGSGPEALHTVTTLLKSTRDRPDGPQSPFWRSTSAPNPSAALLSALADSSISGKQFDLVKYVVLVWGRPVVAVPSWRLPPGCSLVQAGPWDDTTWPPTNLYPLVEQSLHDRGAMKIGPADGTYSRSKD